MSIRHLFKYNYNNKNEILTEIFIVLRKYLDKNVFCSFWYLICTGYNEIK